MKYIATPLSFDHSENAITIERDIEERITMMDNLVELVAFTPIGSFNADPDFGLEYWNSEYANISDTQFNMGGDRDETDKRSLKEQCELSIAASIQAYAPEKLNVTDVVVTMNMKDDEVSINNRHKVYSHHAVVIHVAAMLSDGMGTSFQYTRELSFMVEPVAKRIKI